MISLAGVFILRGSLRIKQTKVVNEYLSDSTALLPAMTLHKFLYYLGQMHCGEGRDDEERLIDFYFRTRQVTPDVDLLIVDEASMVGDKQMWQPGMQFDSGLLLTGLVSCATGSGATEGGGVASK